MRSPKKPTKACLKWVKRVGEYIAELPGVKEISGTGTGTTALYNEEREFELDTKAGKLRLHVSSCLNTGFTVFCRFDDVEAARELFGVERYNKLDRLSPYSGKWNFHYEGYDADGGFTEFRYNIERILPGAEMGLALHEWVKANDIPAVEDPAWQKIK